MQYVIIVRHISGNVAYLGIHSNGYKHMWVSIGDNLVLRPFLFPSVDSATTWSSSHIAAYDSGTEIITLDEFEIMQVMSD